jgi:hypothetical protein
LLTKTELRNVSDTHFDDMVENPEDMYCVIRLHNLVVTRYRIADPIYTGRIFRQEVKRRGKSTSMPNMKKGGVLGHNHFGVIPKSIAKRTGMDQPENCTASSHHRAGIAQLASNVSGCPESVRMFAVTLAPAHMPSIRNPTSR